MSFHNFSYKIVITGGTGFLGSHLLKNEAFKDALAIGRKQPQKHQNFKNVSFITNKNLTKIFDKTEVVVHLAARNHVMNDFHKDPINEYRRVNTLGTLNLAKQAAIAGVKRFIFISTIKVLGEKTEPGMAFKKDDIINPQDPYSISKYEAEKGLKFIGKTYGMEIVIIRPPLIYGQGVKGNFANLIKLVKFPIPIPFGSIKNKRSLVSVENLVDLIITCLDHPNAKNQTFLVSDDDDMSTPLLFSRLAKAGGYNAYIIYFPLIVLYIFFRSFSKLKVFDRLSGSMCVNIEQTKSELNWKPPFKVKESLINCWIKDT
tara:strand:- start:3053 stop:4000 length:948 start_codon:yes stop_codon:yes gene_type:complete